MKALTLWQPWAGAMAEGLKTIETRSWRTSYRGELAIHASKRVQATLEVQTIFRWASAGVKMPELSCVHRGEVLAVVQLVDCIPVEEAVELFPDQVQFGDFSPGRFAWITKRPRRLGAGVVFTGQQGLWEVPNELELQLIGEA